MTMRMKKLFSILAVAATVLLTACDEHQDFPDTATEAFVFEDFLNLPFLKL